MSDRVGQPGPQQWNPEQYERFRQERSQPFFDLMSLVESRRAMRIADLGCGTGEMTLELHKAFEAAETIGIDNSESMLTEAAQRSGAGLSFVRADLREFAAQPENHQAFDLVLSNAALQWVPEQAQVIGQLTSMLKPDGQLAVQVPSNEDHLSHVTIQEVAQESPFVEALSGHIRRFSNLSLEGYAILLDRLGYVRQHVRMQVYLHRLAARDDVVEWVRGSFLTDYERRMSPELFPQFLERYRSLLLERLDDQRPFAYAFKRILVWGSRSAGSRAVERARM
jgi:trans-aconitate 2-methyltransferase